MSARRQVVLEGNNLELLARMPDCSVDAVVTDPPYGIHMMQRSWDAALPDPRTWSECLRVLKPGGHLVAFGAPRLVHRLTCQIEDAGFEVRDQLLWLFGSGFPKSLDVSKAIDKAAGAEREVVGRYQPPNGKPWNLTEDTAAPGSGGYDLRSESLNITAPATPEAARWSGWGTALKPAYEPIILARKPLSGTVAANVLAYGTGAINIDGCRVAAPDPAAYAAKGASVVGLDSAGNTTTYGAYPAPREDSTSPLGRWPANLILDEDAGAMLDAQTGALAGRGNKGPSKRGEYSATSYGVGTGGGASRFFYCPKASRSEREAGLEDLPEVRRTDGRKSEHHTPNLRTSARRNHHATVKPVALMRWLIRLVTPPGGIVLEPFAGSGSTLVACALEDVDAVGMDIDPEYVTIARARVAHACGAR